MKKSSDCTTQTEVANRQLKHKSVDKSKCKHKIEPELYAEWSKKQARKQKTHRLTQCPNCGLWVVWVKK